MAQTQKWKQKKKKEILKADFTNSLFSDLL